MWGQIIGAGISALGSLFGGDDDEQTTTTTVDYKAMVRAAEKAGFNPLTVLRNGGAAGFSTQVHHPAMSSGIAEAAGTIGNFLMSWDPQAQRRADLEYQIAAAQLDLIQRGGNTGGLPSVGMRSLGGVPTWTGPTRSGGNAAVPAAAGSQANPIPLSVWYRTDQGNVVRGPNPDVADVEQMLTRWLFPAQQETFDTPARVEKLPARPLAHPGQNWRGPQSPAYNDGSWIWDYIPSFDIEWR